MHQKLLRLESLLLNEAPTVVNPQALQSVVACGVNEEYAYALLVASAFDLQPDNNEDDARFFRDYLLPSIHRQEVTFYSRNPYYANIHVPEAHVGTVRITTRHYEPYEAFPCGNLQLQPNRSILAPLGFFNQRFDYPTVLQDERIWMTVTPNEIITIQPAIDIAHDNVLAFGLGLGYFPFMATLKPEVNRVTIVDNNPLIISLFQQHILPQFPHPQKIELICDDAFHYAETHHFCLDQATPANVVFTDLWHDVSDGAPLYQRMKSLETLALPCTQFCYWIEPSILYYL